MNISPISFGKTVKVYAPFHEAVRIANAANGGPTVSNKVQEQVKDIFDDTKNGHALAFTFDDNSKYCYIFSGDESREYQHNLFNKAKLVRKIKMNYPITEALPKVLKAKEDFTNKTIELINQLIIFFNLAHY